ncbi:MAG: hypothetical protein JNL28_01295 [Planctomycetes bacterium]|nr:hypothetical protein [Planctomycetota bacterium]
MEEESEPFARYFKDYEDERENFEANSDEFRRGLESYVDEILNIARRHHPFDIIAYFTLANTTNIGSGDETRLAIELEAYVDYLATLLCGADMSTYDVTREHVIDGAELESIHDLLRRLFSGVTVLHSVSHPPSDVTEMSMVDMRASRLRGHFTYLRRYGLRAHWIQAIRDMLSPISSTLSAALGFDHRTALEIGNAAVELYKQRVTSLYSQSAKLETDLRNAVGQTRRKGRQLAWTEAIIPRSMLDELVRQPPSKANKSIRQAAVHTVFHRIGDALVVDLDSLCSGRQIDVDAVRRYLLACSVPWASLPPSHDRLPSQQSPFDEYAFVRIDQGYFMPRPALPARTLLATIDRLLGPSQSVPATPAWESYNRARASFLETRACELLSKCLRADLRHTSLTYTLVSSGKSVQYELDGLVARGRTLLLIEAKAGRITAPARRGAEKSVLKDSKSLHTNAISQAVRARDYIRSADSVEFQLLGGQSVAIRQADYTEIVLVVATLEETDPMVSIAHAARVLGIKHEEDYPWFASYFHLTAIAPLVEFPTQLLHFLSRRRSLGFEGRMMAHDETDWFGAYQVSRLLSRPGTDDPNEVVMLDEYGDPIEHYYINTLDRGRDVQPPRMSVPPLVRQLLIELDSLPFGDTVARWVLNQHPRLLESLQHWLEARPPSRFEAPAG